MAIKCVSYFDRLDQNKKKSKTFASKSGTKVITEYGYKYIDGIQKLVPIGETNIFDEIQSHKKSADLNHIIQRFLNGESDLLNVHSSVYADFRDVPSSYAELFDRLEDCKRVFDGLPVEVKEEFDNSYEKFWSDFGSDSFNDKLFKNIDPEIRNQAESGISDFTISKDKLEGNLESNNEIKGGEVNAK